MTRSPLQQGSFSYFALANLRVHGPMTAAQLGERMSRTPQYIAARLVSMRDRGLIKVIDKAGRGYVWAAATMEQGLYHDD